MDRIVKSIVILVSLFFIASQFMSYSFDFVTDQLAGINALNNKVESELVEARVQGELAVLESEKEFKVNKNNAKSVFYQSFYFFGAISVIISVMCFMIYTVLYFLDKGHERVSNIQERVPMVRLSVTSTRALIDEDKAKLSQDTSKQLTANREAYRVS